MEWLAFPAFILGSFALFFAIQWAIHANRRQHWRAFAQQHGGTFVRASGLFNAMQDYISLSIEGYEVRLDRCLIRYGLNHARCERVTILGAAPSPLTAQIFKRASLTARFVKPLGQALQTGDARFDDVFIVQSEQPQALVHHLDPEAMNEHLRQSHMHLKLEHGQLTLTRQNHTYNHEALYAHMRLGALYARGLFGHDAAASSLS